MNVLNVFLFSGFFFVLRYVLFNYVFKSIPERHGITDQKTNTKFCESGFKVVYYLPAWCVGFYLAAANGLTDTKDFWRGYPFQPLSQTVVTFYEMQLGFYIYLQITHMFFDVKQKDFMAMFLHHAVTIALISCAYWYSYWRFGLAVFFTMDLVDVFLEVAKSFHYLEYEVPANIFFIIMAVSWFLFRVFLFSYLIMPSAWYEAIEIHTLEGFKYHMSTWWLFNVLLWTIFVLQVYWLFAIYQTAKSLFIKGKVTDVMDVKEHSS
jgi:hypothetical protein